ncbi:MAG: creatininase family protein [Bacillota bacterium]|nr:creatininase family protein [Bacillota bacterium]
MRLADITWPKAEQYFKEKDTVMIPIGSIECHGRHMPVGTDMLIPDKIAELVEEKSDILIVPTIPFGACQSLAPFPGTIHIDSEVLYLYVRQIVDSLYRHGARKIIFLNGHGGNVSTLERIGLEYEEKGVMTVLLNWWLMAWDMNPEWKGGHGGGEETAAIMGIDPSLVDYSEIGGPLKMKDVNENIVATGWRSVKFKGVQVDILRSTRSITDNGWIGTDHPNTATEEWGKEMIKTTADYIVDFIEELKKVEL